MINIGGKYRPVKYNLNALIEFEELSGFEVLEAKDNTQLFAKLKVMRALAFVGLKHGAKDEKQEVDFNIEDVGSWLTTESMSEFFRAFNNDSSSDKVPESEEEPKK